MKDQANPALSKPGGQELGMRDPRARVRVAVSARWPARLHWRPPASTAGAHGEARPSATFFLLCFSPRILLQGCLRNLNCTLSDCLTLPWVFHVERTLLYMYNFALKFFKQNIYMLFIYLFKRLPW